MLGTLYFVGKHRVPFQHQKFFGLLRRKRNIILWVSVTDVANFPLKIHIPSPFLLTAYGVVRCQNKNMYVTALFAPTDGHLTQFWTMRYKNELLEDFWATSGFPDSHSTTSSEIASFVFQPGTQMRAKSGQAL